MVDEHRPVGYATAIDMTRKELEEIQRVELQRSWLLSPQTQNWPLDSSPVGITCESPGSLSFAFSGWPYLSIQNNHVISIQ